LLEEKEAGELTIEAQPQDVELWIARKRYQVAVV